MRYWGLRLGEGGKHVEACKNGGFIAIGWRELGDLSWVRGMEPATALKELRQRIRQTYKISSEIRASLLTGTLWRFLFEMKVGDRVLCPWPARWAVLIGEITGTHEYRATWGDGCDYPNRRTARWLKEVRRGVLPERLKTSLGAFITLFRLDEHKAEIEAILTGVAPPPPPKADLSTEVIRRIMGLPPRDFEEFVCHLLGLAGFLAATTQSVGDKGVDVVGSLSAEGLADITLKVQVKRVRGNLGIGDVLKTKGTLGSEEHGAIVTTGGFTAQARQEAEAPGRRPIKLLDRDGLVDLILRHYDELREDYKNLLRLRRRHLPLIGQFEFVQEP